MRLELVTLIQVELHLLIAEELYINSPVPPIWYHIGRPI